MLFRGWSIGAVVVRLIYFLLVAGVLGLLIANPLTVVIGDRTVSRPLTGSTFFTKFGFALLMVATAVMMIAIVQRRITREYRSKSSESRVSASELIRDIDAKGSEYLLILRPFGADGYLHVPRSKGLLETVVNPAAETVTIEQLIARVARKTAALATVALVDPVLDELAPGPIYVAAEPQGETWKSDVALLAARAYGVIFAFPPSRGSTPSVSWELSQVLATSPPGGIALILPDAERKNAADMASIMRTFGRVVDFGEIVDAGHSLDDLMMVYLSDPILYWIERFSKRWSLRRQRVADTTYIDALESMLTDMKAEVEAIPAGNRYPHHVPPGIR